MATYYVAPTGSDTNPGTAASPWKTLTKAAQSVSTAGTDKVYVTPGTYTDTISMTNGFQIVTIPIPNYVLKLATKVE
jgi:hypothetical protein